MRRQPALVTCCPRAGKKNLSLESETSAKGLGSSQSFASPRLVGPQPVSAHPPRVLRAAGKPEDALISLWPLAARRGAKRLKLRGSLPPPGGRLTPLLQGTCPARACSLLQPSRAPRVSTPRRVVAEMVKEGVVPKVGEEGSISCMVMRVWPHLQRFPSPGFSFCSSAHHLYPPTQ